MAQKHKPKRKVNYKKNYKKRKVISPKSLFQDNFRAINSNSMWASVVCPHPNHSGLSANAGYHPEKEIYTCYGKCSKVIHGNDNIINFLINECQFEVDFSLLEYTYVNNLINKKDVDISHIFKYPIAVDNEYLDTRGVSNETIKKYNIRYYNGRVYVPTYNISGKVTGFNTRSTDGKGSRYKFYGVKNRILREDFLLDFDKEKPLFITEGMFGEFRLFKLGLQACSILGSNDLKIGLFSPFQKIIGCFDDDAAGRSYGKKLLEQYPLANVLYGEFDEISSLDFKDDIQI